jgi:transposase
MDCPYPSVAGSANVEVHVFNITSGEAAMEQITTVGIDLAKSVVSVHGVDARGNTVLRKTLSAARLMEFMARVAPCRVGMEACSGAHAVARGLQALGHDARIMAPKFVVPYRKNQKNDGNDAEAICEAVGRPKMRFVPVKSAEQQTVLVVHRVRAELVTARAGLINQVRGLLAEFGLVMPKGRFTFRHQVAAVLDDARVPTLARTVLQEVVARIRALDEDILAYDRRIDAQVRDSEPMQRIGELCGVGPITASAIVASVGDAKLFKNGRQFAAWLGLVPRQYSTGGKPILGRITKRGDVYLRTLLVHGARSALITLARRNDRLARWAAALIARRGFKRACVAMAAKNARVIWALLARGEALRLEPLAATA